MDTQKILTIIQECLEKLTIDDATVEVSEGGLHPVFNIKTEDSKKLIGNHGDNLRALNYIVKRIVEKRLALERPNFLLDVNGYQESHNDEIRKKAQMLIERARTFKTSAEMEPMNAYERMIVHSMAAETTDIETESLGEGRTKRLVIRYKEPQQDTL